MSSPTGAGSTWSPPQASPGCTCSPPKALVTVLIDTYNHGRYIEEAIDSVLSQDFPADQMEVLIVDDGSTDDTGERVQKYGERVHYLYKPNGGQASAFNFGFARARGEIVALLDGDDTWLPGKLKRIVEEFEKHPEVGMIYHPFLEVDTKTGERRKSRMSLVSGSFFDKRKEFFGYGSPGTCASFRRAPLARIMPIPEGLRIQADTYIGSLIAFVAPVLALPECLATYRFHAGNLYHQGGQVTLDILKKRRETTDTLMESIDRWLRQHDYGWDVRFQSFVGRVALWHERNTFRIAPPGRLRFFWFLLRENYTSSPVQTWAYTVFRYLAAFPVLIVGFHNVDLMNRCEDRVLESAKHIRRRVFGERRGAGSASTLSKPGHAGNS
jgi:glycosyltransferase involved in cell wall biosynthesis